MHRRDYTYTLLFIVATYFLYKRSHDDDDTTKNFTFAHLTLLNNEHIGDDDDLQCKLKLKM